MGDDRGDGDEVRVDAGGDVEEADAVDGGPQQRSTLNCEQAREEVTRLVEACAQSGIPADDVADLLRERADGVEYLYEGMQRYARPGDDE